MFDQKNLVWDIELCYLCQLQGGLNVLLKVSTITAWGVGTLLTLISTLIGDSTFNVQYHISMYAGGTLQLSCWQLMPYLVHRSLSDGRAPLSLDKSPKIRAFSSYVDYSRCVAAQPTHELKLATHMPPCECQNTTGLKPSKPARFCR